MAVSTKHMTKTGLYLGFVAVAILAFLLFEPVFVWNWGWKAMPTAAGVEGEEFVASTTDPNLFAGADDVVAEAMKAGELPSVSAAIAVEGSLVWAKAYGYADLSEAEPATLRSQYRIGSSSKPVTASLAARLVEAGLLDLDAPIHEAVPYFPEKAFPITARQLLSHTAGIRNYGTCLCFPIWEYENKRHFESVEDAVSVFAASPLLFEPGTGFSYSSYGTNLLSGVLEGAGGGDFLSLLEKHVTRPLGLTFTTADRRDLLEDHRVEFYDVRDGSYKKAFPVDNSIKWAGGGLVSTPTEMTRLGSAWLGSDFVSAGTRELFWTPQFLDDGTVNPQSYALGWRSSKSTAIFGPDRAIRIVHHNGTAKGSTSAFVLYPDYGVAVSVMTNKSIVGDDPFWKIQSRIVGPLIRHLDETARSREPSDPAEGKSTIGSGVGEEEGKGSQQRQSG